MSYVTRFLQVEPIPLLKDNYAYLLRCLSTKQIAIVDVAIDCAPVVQKSLKTLVPQDELRHFRTILTTHKHGDHAGGNAHMLELFPEVRIVAGAHETINGPVHQRVNDGDTFKIGELSVRVLHTPAHTRGHVLYHVTHVDDASGVLFTGDTLFVGGGGRTFEGSANEMVSALQRIFKEIPGTTRMFCGHEYALMFLNRFQYLEQSNEKMKDFHKWVIQQREQGNPVTGLPLQEEKNHNMYVRAALGLWRTPDVQSTHSGDEATVQQFLKAYDVPR